MKYTYKGNNYKIIGKIPFKDPNTREWHLGVIYKQKQNKQSYVREEKEFYSRFKKELSWWRKLINLF